MSRLRWACGMGGRAQINPRRSYNAQVSQSRGLLDNTANGACDQHPSILYAVVRNRILKRYVVYKIPCVLPLESRKHSRPLNAQAQWPP